YVWLAVAMWAAVSGVAAAVAARRDGAGAVLRELARAAGPALGAFVIGAGLAAVPILGALELSGQIARQGVSYRLALASRLPLRAWPTTLLPNYLGNPLDGNYAGAPPVYTQTTFYAGVLALPL